MLADILTKTIPEIRQDRRKRQSQGPSSLGLREDYGACRKYAPDEAG